MVWSDYEIKYLRENYSSKRTKDLAEHLSLSVSSVRHILNRLGLKKKRGYFRDNGDIHECNKDYFKTLSTKSCYIIGFLLADGHISDNTRNRISIGLSSRDISVLEFIRSEICPSAKISNRKRDICYLNFSSKEIVKDLDHLGLRHRKSGGSEIIGNIPYQLIPSFLRGFFDGNGCFHWRKRIRGKYESIEAKFSLCGPDIKVMEEFKRYLGFGYIVDQTTYYYLQSSSFNSIKEFYDIIYSDDSFRLDRKKEKFITYFKEKV